MSETVSFGFHRRCEISPDFSWTLSIGTFSPKIHETAEFHWGRRLLKHPDPVSRETDPRLSFGDLSSSMHRLSALFHFMTARFPEASNNSSASSPRFFLRFSGSQLFVPRPRNSFIHSEDLFYPRNRSRVLHSLTLRNDALRKLLLLFP